jgi:hypothetical protein
LPEFCGLGIAALARRWCGSRDNYVTDNSLKPLVRLWVTLIAGAARWRISFVSSTFRNGGCGKTVATLIQRHQLFNVNVSTGCAFLKCIL